MQSSSSVSPKRCAICLDGIVPQPSCEEEKERRLDCSHIFHRECIGEWLKRKHNCPLCRAPVAGVTTDEEPFRPAEMTQEEILAVPDDDLQRLADDLLFFEVRHTIREIRHVRRLNLNENTPLANTARKVHSIAGAFFGWS